MTNRAINIISISLGGLDFVLAIFFLSVGEIGFGILFMINMVVNFLNYRED